MDAVVDPELFHSAPHGRYYIGPCYFVWCWDRTLTGSVVWGRPSEAEARALVRLYEIDEHLAKNFDVITDASRMSLVAPAAFAVVADYLRNRLPIARLRKNAVVMPEGIIGAAIAGLYPMLGATPNWRPVTTMQAAIDWLDTAESRAAAPQIRELIVRTTGRSILLHRLHVYLLANLVDASIDRAAHSLGMSRRSLQRGLANVDTRFRDELERVRIEEATRRLAEGDDKLEALAIELGFSSASHFGAAYLAATGETPGQFRARFR